MNPYTGHLVATEPLPSDEYEEAPEKLRVAAKLELAGRSEVVVGLESTGSISRWAKAKREKRKKLAMSGKL